MSKSNPFRVATLSTPKSFYVACAGTVATRGRYRQVAEMMNERGEYVHHTTVFRWVQEYAPEIDKPEATPLTDHK